MSNSGMELQNWSQQWYLSYWKHRNQRMCFSAGYSRLYYYVHTHWGWDIWMLSQQSVFFYFVFQNNSIHTHTHFIFISAFKGGHQQGGRKRATERGGWKTGTPTCRGLVLWEPLKALGSLNRTKLPELIWLYLPCYLDNTIAWVKI